MNYNQYLKDYWPEEDPNEDVSNNDITEVQQEYYSDQVTCIDRQIAELEARKYALQHGYCFTGYNDTFQRMKTYPDPYNLDERFHN